MKKIVSAIVLFLFFVGSLSIFCGCQLCTHDFGDWSTLQETDTEIVRQRKCNKCKENETLTIIKTVLDIGLNEEVRFLQVTDSHWALSDERDTRSDRKTSRKRAKRFDYKIKGQHLDLYSEAINYAIEKNLFVLHTGDLADTFSSASYEYLDNAFDGVNYIVAPGNHDFERLGLQYGGESFKEESLNLLAPHVKNDLTFDTVTLGEVILVTMDDSAYTLSESQIERLQKEAAKGLPIILCMHIPIFTNEFADVILENNDAAYLLGATDEYLDKYTPKRRLQQAPDKITLDAIDYILSESAIKAVITGHTHLNYENYFSDGKRQISTAGTFDGYARLIIVK